MINNINNNPLTTILSKKGEKSKNSNGFVDFLKNYINDVNNKQINADNKIEQFLKGDEKDITNVVLSVEKAEVSLQLFLQIRNKLIQAYQDIMRIQV